MYISKRLQTMTLPMRAEEVSVDYYPLTSEEIKSLIDEAKAHIYLTQTSRVKLARIEKVYQKPTFMPIVASPRVVAMLEELLELRSAKTECPSVAETKTGNQLVTSIPSEVQIWTKIRLEALGFDRSHKLMAKPVSCFGFIVRLPTGVDASNIMGTKPQDEYIAGCKYWKPHGLIRYSTLELVLNGEKHAMFFHEETDLEDEDEYLCKEGLNHLRKHVIEVLEQLRKQKLSPKKGKRAASVPPRGHEIDDDEDED